MFLSPLNCLRMVYLCLYAKYGYIKLYPVHARKVSRDFARAGSGALLRSRVPQRVDGAGALSLPRAIARRPACSVTRFRLRRGLLSHSHTSLTLSLAFR